MKKYLFLFMILMVFSSHDLFLKMDSYFLAPNESSTLKLYNGTFQKSENVIDRNRMLDVSLVANGQHARLDTSQWSEKDSVTILSFDTKRGWNVCRGCVHKSSKYRIIC